MISTYTATKPTLEQAMAYVVETERRWQQAGQIAEIPSFREEDGLGIWTIKTTQNLWDVWMRLNADGSETVYGEC